MDQQSLSNPELGHPVIEELLRNIGDHLDEWFKIALSHGFHSNDEIVHVLGILRKISHMMVNEFMNVLLLDYFNRRCLTLIQLSRVRSSLT